MNALLPNVLGAFPGCVSTYPDARSYICDCDIAKSDYALSLVLVIVKFNGLTMPSPRRHSQEAKEDPRVENCSRIFLGQPRDSGHHPPRRIKRGRHRRKGGGPPF